MRILGRTACWAGGRIASEYPEKNDFLCVRELGGNFTFLVLTDRDDLETQIYKTFARCGVVDNDRDPCRASSGDNLTQLLTQHKSYVFSLIQKFNQTVIEGEAYT